MTLNVIINNMVAVDSEVSHGGSSRTTDNFQKSEIFTGDKYHGIIIGCGYGIVLQDAISLIRRTSTGHNLADLMAILETEQKERYTKRRESILAQIAQEIKEKNILIPSPDKQADYNAQEFRSKVEEFQKKEGEAQPSGSLYVLTRDKETGILWKYWLPDHPKAVLWKSDIAPIITDGSGADLAGAYLSTSTSGIDWTKLSPQMNFYFITLACAAATANTGVGGFMQMGLVGDDEAKYLDAEKVNSAVRVCCKQIAGDISKKEAIKIVTGIFDGKADYKKIARQADIAESDLLYAPGRLHQDVSKFNLRMGQ